MVGISARAASVRSATAALLAIALGLAGAPFGVEPTLAASCVTFAGGTFNAPGDDTTMPGLNGEWVAIRNRCSGSVGPGVSFTCAIITAKWFELSNGTAPVTS